MFLVIIQIHRTFYFDFYAPYNMSFMYRSLLCYKLKPKLPVEIWQVFKVAVPYCNRKVENAVSQLIYYWGEVYKNIFLEDLSVNLMID